MRATVAYTECWCLRISISMAEASPSLTLSISRASSSGAADGMSRASSMKIPLYKHRFRGKVVPGRADGPENIFIPFYQDDEMKTGLFPLFAGFPPGRWKGMNFPLIRSHMSETPGKIFRHLPVLLTGTKTLGCC